MEENNTKQASQKPIVGAILIVGLMIAGAILIKGGERPIAVNNPGLGSPNNEVEPSSANIRPISKDDHILGDPKAEIIIVEYSDTECPFCKVFHNTMHQVVKQSGGNVAWVYRHYPIPQLHEKAEFEAEATECAWEQGGNEMFWAYIDQIFARTNSNDSLPESELGKIANDLNLDPVAFTACLESGKYADKVANDVIDGQNAGVRGTPSSFILQNGKVVGQISGAQTLQAILAKIQSLKY